MHPQTFASSWINGKPFFVLLPLPGELQSCMFGGGWSSSLPAYVSIASFCSEEDAGYVYLLWLVFVIATATSCDAAGSGSSWRAAGYGHTSFSVLHSGYSHRFDLQPSVLQEFVFLFFC